MFLAYSDMERNLALVIDRIEQHYAEPWLKHPASSELEQAQDVCPILPVPAHINSTYEMCCVLRGTVLLQLEHRVIQLTEGQFFILPPNTLHYELPNRVYSGNALWFNMHSDRVNINASDSRPDGSFTILHGQQVKMDALTINLAVAEIAKELHSDQHRAYSLCKSALLHLLLTIHREMKKQGQRLTASQWRESVVREVMVYLQSRQSAIPEMNDLAEHCAMNPNHLNSVFKAVTGKTVTAYCNDLRIEQAKYLLEATELKLHTLSEQLGYYDQYHFCKAFKKATGMSPSQYRNEKKTK